MKTEDATAAKRASTEEESESSVSKKPKIEDDTKMGEEEEESESESDSDSGRAWSVEGKEDEEEEEEVDKDPGYKMIESEPEWDKDSYEERGCEFHPKNRNAFPSDEAYEEVLQFKINVWKNRGFIEDPFRAVYQIPNLDELWTTTTKREYLTNLANLCVKKLNEEKGTTVEVVDIVRANLKPGGRWKVYITFMARECPNGPLVEYQAKAMDFCGHQRPPFPILCRPASSIL